MNSAHLCGTNTYNILEDIIEYFFFSKYMVNKNLNLVEKLLHSL